MTINSYAIVCFFFSKGQVKETFEAITQKSKGNKKRKENLFIKEQSLAWLHDELCGPTSQWNKWKQNRTQPLKSLEMVLKVIASKEVFIFKNLLKFHNSSERL